MYNFQGILPHEITKSKTILLPGFARWSEVCLSWFCVSFLQNGCGKWRNYCLQDQATSTSWRRKGTAWEFFNQSMFLWSKFHYQSLLSRFFDQSFTVKFLWSKYHCQRYCDQRFTVIKDSLSSNIHWQASAIKDSLSKFLWSNYRCQVSLIEVSLSKSLWSSLGSNWLY